MADTEQRALELLRAAVGSNARFHDGQLEAIRTLVEERGRALVVQRTGWGKSVVYFIATRLLRHQGAGPTILISPLLALMRDQRIAAAKLGLNAVTMNSSNRDDWEVVEQAIADDEVDLLLISPERLANEDFRGRVIASIERGIGLFVVDEAHCISDWGHDFRVDYQRIRRLVEALPENVPLLATTATANERVQEDVAGQLGEHLKIVRGPLSRDSLHIQIIPLEHQAERLAWLADYLQQVQGSGIIYTLTTRDARIVSEWLISREINAPAYHAKLEDADDLRPQLEEDLRENRVKALVATVALGMGFDKPDLGFVVHYQRPGSVVDYYQQVGRAGRGIDRAEIVLLTGAEDDAIGDYFIDNAFPSEDELLMVLEAIEDEISIPGLERKLNLDWNTLDRATKFLNIEGAIAKDGGRWSRTPNLWTPNPERGARITDLRHAEQQRMRDYVHTDECLMLFLANELDDPCGRCANCNGDFVDNEPDPKLVLEAVRFLRHSYRPISPRKQWPFGLGGRIASELRLCEGRALCMYGDAGWGELVRRGKFVDDHFDDELVEAVTEMIDEEWQPDPNPTWVTSVPSRRNPELVASVARRLAAALNLPYREALVKVADTPQQKTMTNSYQQALNARDAFVAVPEQVLEGEPVLLIDDMVDSKWSLTVCGIALREAGSGEVHPVALAETTKASDSS